jgi:hypothetical protein
LPERAPIDLIAGSRDILRGQIRAPRWLTAGSSLLAALVFTWSATESVDVTLGIPKAPYWLLTATGYLVGLVLASATTLWRTRSSQRQLAAVERAWQQALHTSEQQAGTNRRRLLVFVVTVAIVAIAFGLACTMGSYRLLYFWTLPIIGLNAGTATIRLLVTFRWARWYGAGAIDPDVAKQLVSAHKKARKVQHHAESYAQSHPSAGDESA